MLDRAQHRSPATRSANWKTDAIGPEEVDRRVSTSCARRGGGEGSRPTSLIGEHQDEEVAGPPHRATDDGRPAGGIGVAFAQATAERARAVQREDDRDGDPEVAIRICNQWVVSHAEPVATKSCACSPTSDARKMGFLAAAATAAVLLVDNAKPHHAATASRAFALATGTIARSRKAISARSSRLSSPVARGNRRACLNIA